MRLQAIRGLSDPEVLRHVLEAAADPDLLKAALDRTVEIEGQVADPRNVEVRRILLDPVIVKHYGRLDLDCRISTDERRYIKERDEGKEQPAKGKVLMESVGLAIREGDEVLFRKTYRGNKARRAEPFNPGAPVQGGYLVKVNRTDIDYVEIGEALLRPLDGDLLKSAAASENKYVRAAAIALSDSWRTSVPAKIESDGEEEDDGD